MSEIADRYRRNAAAFTDKVAGVPDDGWDAPTPCEEWTVRDLVGHVMQTQGMFLGFVGRELPDLPDVADNPLAAWTGARDAVQTDLEDPERAGAEFDGVLGRTTFADAVDRFLSFDLTVHGWDLARATGQDETIDPEEISRIQAGAEGFGDSMRSPGALGPAVDPPDDADEQGRLLAFLGRQA